VHSNGQARLAAAGSAALAGAAVLTGATMEVGWTTLWFAVVCAALGLVVGRAVVFGGRVGPWTVFGRLP
jgi:hypothetical protein